MDNSVEMVYVPVSTILYAIAQCTMEMSLVGSSFRLTEKEYNFYDSLQKTMDIAIANNKIMEFEQSLSKKQRDWIADIYQKIKTEHVKAMDLYERRKHQ